MKLTENQICLVEMDYERLKVLTIEVQKAEYTFGLRLIEGTNELFQLCVGHFVFHNNRYPLKLNEEPESESFHDYKDEP